jgi:hypothetical protein
LSDVRPAQTASTTLLPARSQPILHCVRRLERCSEQLLVDCGRLLAIKRDRLSVGPPPRITASRARGVGRLRVKVRNRMLGHHRGALDDVDAPFQAKLDLADGIIEPRYAIHSGK